MNCLQLSELAPMAIVAHLAAIVDLEAPRPFARSAEPAATRRQSCGGLSTREFELEHTAVLGKYWHSRTVQSGRQWEPGRSRVRAFGLSTGLVPGQNRAAVVVQRCCQSRCRIGAIMVPNERRTRVSPDGAP